jgi:hypothetical protein
MIKFFAPRTGEVAGDAAAPVLLVPVGAWELGDPEHPAATTATAARTVSRKWSPPLRVTASTTGGTIRHHARRRPNTPNFVRLRQQRQAPYAVLFS